jgi:Protein of unknown function (DUF2735)
MMMTTVDHGSATIYQFPARGRFAQGAAAQHEAARDTQQAVAPRVASSGGWYHDAAIEAERASKN